MSNDNRVLDVAIFFVLRSRPAEAALSPGRPSRLREARRRTYAVSIACSGSFFTLEVTSPVTYAIETGRCVTGSTRIASAASNERS